MTNITTIMQTHLERIISEGNLSTDDIHNLSLVDRVLFQEVTNPRRVQALWERHLPFPTLFLFDRPVHVYDYESESDEIGRVFVYSKKLYQGQQLVCRKVFVEGKTDVLIAELVLRRYDLWLSFVVGDRLQTVGDILFFHDRLSNDFSVDRYMKFMEDNMHNPNGPVPVYAEISHVFGVVLEGVQRVQEGTAQDDIRFDFMLGRVLIPMLTKGYLNLDSFFSILYLMGKEVIDPGPFEFMSTIMSNILRAFEGDLNKNQKHLRREKAVQLAQVEYPFYMYLGGSSQSSLDGLFLLSDTVEGREEEKDNEALQALYALYSLPGFTLDGFSASVHFDYSYRSTQLLTSQLTCFKEMVEGGHLTFERLQSEYPCVISEQFNIATCTPTFLEVLSNRLISFHVIDSNYFQQMPYFFHLQDQGELKVPEALENFSTSFIRFLHDMKTRGLQKDFEELYALPFFELFKPLTRFTFYTPAQFLKHYMQIDTGLPEANTEVPLFNALRQREFTADIFMTLYKEFVEKLEQTLATHLHSLEISSENRRFLENSKPTHALLMRLFMFSYSKRLESMPLNTIQESLTYFTKTFKAFCAEVITSSLIVTVTDEVFRKEYKEFYGYFTVMNSFVKSSASSHQYTVEKRQKFDGLLSSIDALEYLSCLKEKDKDYPFDKLLVFTQSVRAFNRRVIELTMRCSFDLPNDPILIDIDLDIDEQLAFYSVLSDPRTANIYVEISRQYYLVMASLFGDKSALNLVNRMIKEALFFKMSVYIASGRWTIEQFSDYILTVLKMAFRIRSRTFINTVRFEILIGHCMRAYMNELSQSIVERRECDFDKVKRLLVGQFSLELPEIGEIEEVPADEVAEDEAV